MKKAFAVNYKRIAALLLIFSCLMTFAACRKAGNSSENGAESDFSSAADSENTSAMSSEESVLSEIESAESPASSDTQNSSAESQQTSKPVESVSKPAGQVSKPAVKPQKPVVPNTKPYYLKVNKKANCVTVYKKDAKGNYTVPVKAMICSTGPATPLGTFRTINKYRWRPLIHHVWGQYATRIVGSFLFHSVPYAKQDPSALLAEEYNKLGSSASAGCVRLTVEDSKWIMDNCPLGTTVTIYEDANPGPLGKPSAQKIPKDSGWDPTDPLENNPWKDKIPETSKPESSKPETSKPESSKPESSKPESSNPVSSKPESHSTSSKVSSSVSSKTESSSSGNAESMTESTSGEPQGTESK